MKKIRQKAFETNSSSSHSITISDSDAIYDTILPDKDGKIFIVGDQYGWDWFKTNDPLEKARYCATNNTPHEVLKQVIKDHTQCDYVEIYVSKDTYNHYVDHESIGICPTTYDEVKKFIFDKNSWLFGGNDNQYSEPNFYDVNKYDKDGKIISTKYKWYVELDIKNIYKNKYYFYKKPTNEQIKKAITSIVNNRSLGDDGYLSGVVDQNFDDDTFTLSLYTKPIDFERKICYFLKVSDRNITKSSPAKEVKFHVKRVM